MIEWTDETWNPIRGCSRVSEGCRNCYAEEQADRIVRMDAAKGRPSKYAGLVRVVDGDARWTGEVAFDADKLSVPLRWRKPLWIFVNSMSDLFHDGFTNEQIAAVFGVMAACQQHTFIVLTKRAQRMREFFEWLEIEASKQARARWSARHLREEAEIEHARADVAMAGELDACATYADKAVNSQTRDILHCFPVAGEATTWPLPNVILGVSVENQAAADERIPHLLATPAAVRAISAEPLLGPLDLSAFLGALPAAAADFTGIEGVRRGIDWLIAGCERGPGARPCAVGWLRSLRNQCVNAEVPFFLKQAAATVHESSDTHGLGALEFGDGSKRKPGGIVSLPYLDGVQWTQRPEVQR